MIVIETYLLELGARAAWLVSRPEDETDIKLAVRQALNRAAREKGLLL
jgi:hypothetical protein